MTRSEARAAERAARRERSVFGVPARFMRPRIVLLASVLLLVGFGALMVYSASSITALTSEVADAAYYLKRQLLFAGVGIGVAYGLSRIDYHLWVRKALMVVWVITVLLLVAVLFVGTDNDMGANRWIDLGFFDLQPSEFAKITVIFTAASLAERYFEEGSLDWGSFVKLLAIGVAVPVGLILLQPDKGTTMVLALTLIVMGYLAGLPKRLLLILLVAGIVGFFAISMRDDYSRSRLLAMLDPWNEEYRYGTGWQLVQGYYAFGTGGLFGVGIGFSRQKYAYLPMAHNDFIFAIIGEECGLVGTVGLLAGFAVFMWAGLEIARRAPDLAGRLVAAGCTSLVIIQLLLNVSGVLGLFPLSGKPIPFVSYGGSSILASMMLVGVIWSVSHHSRLPETAHDSARRSMRVAPEPSGGDPGLSFVGEATPRSDREARPGGGAGRQAPRSTPLASRFEIVEGGGEPTRARGRATRPERTSPRGGSRGRGRIDLGPSATDRLRGRRNSPRD